MVKAQLVWVAKSKIFLNVSWIIINLVHHLLNLNWSEIYPGGGEVKSQSSRLSLSFILFAKFILVIFLLAVKQNKNMKLLIGKVF